MELLNEKVFKVRLFLAHPLPLLPPPPPPAKDATFFLTPYLSEILETIFFLVEIWHHREIQNGVNRVQDDLNIVDVKLNEILAARPLVNNPVMTNLTPARTPLVHRSHVMQDLIRFLFHLVNVLRKLMKMFV